MAWNDRIREAACTSPSGVRFIFTYENLRKAFDKLGTAFNFVDADGTYIQPSGQTGDRYPLRMIFWGGDYDLEADAFEAALLEKGIWKLEHPIYGVADVVPFGTISRRDDLKTAANQAIIDVVFWETIGVVYPTSQDDPAASVIAAVDEYNDAIAEEIDATLILDTEFKKVTTKNNYTALLDEVDAALSGVAAVQNDVLKQFNNIKDSIDRGIDVLIDDPLTLARQTVIMIQAPARAADVILARLDAYGNLAKSIIDSAKAIVTGDNGDFDSNEFHTKDLYVSSYVSGSVLSVVNNQFATKPEALSAAEEILSQMDSVTDWRDDNFAALDQIDTGGSYQKLQDAVALAAGFLVEISFTLKQERTVTLDRDRTIIDLAAELYGTVDSDLDFLIQSNNLTGSEIIEIPRGKNIVYYV